MSNIPCGTSLLMLYKTQQRILPHCWVELQVVWTTVHTDSIRAILLHFGYKGHRRHNIGGGRREKEEGVTIIFIIFSRIATRYSERKKSILLSWFIFLGGGGWFSVGVFFLFWIFFVFFFWIFCKRCFFSSFPGVYQIKRKRTERRRIKQRERSWLAIDRW